MFVSLSECASFPTSPVPQHKVTFPLVIRHFLSAVKETLMCQPPVQWSSGNLINNPQNPHLFLKGHCFSSDDNAQVQDSLSQILKAPKHMNYACAMLCMSCGNRTMRGWGNLHNLIYLIWICLWQQTQWRRVGCSKMRYSVSKESMLRNLCSPFFNLRKMYSYQSVPLSKGFPQGGNYTNSFN